MNGAHRLFLKAAVRVALAWFFLIAQAWAGGPRYVSGPPFFTGPAGVPVGWRQTQLTYSTDPGDLSAYVNHAAADAMVAAAANVWNLPVANITIAQSGQLAEDVTGANSYLGPRGLVFPADVMSTNAAAVPIAVIYDSDGAITDLLLGSGASLPAECAQNGVTESVDAFNPAGYILHAIVVVNGRCAGSAPQAQLQLQYQLMRIFGRVLGLAWSQTNDNVFTGATTPTYAQELNWPIMHPIDILCGSYSYQCLPNPFQLRPDDIAAMVTVYPVTQAAPGKQISLANATGMTGIVTFPSGEGMAGVNVLVKRQTLLATSADMAYEASAVTGTMFRRAGVSPFVAAGTDAVSSMGTSDQNYEGWYGLEYVPMIPGQGGETLLLTVEPVNPLYIGEHSVGPYAPGMVALSGTAPAIAPAFGVDEGGLGWQAVTVPAAPATCSSGTDGTLGEPMQMPVTGWWNGLLCGYGHASYVGVEVKPARTFTVEVTALNEQGLATTAKAMPVIGVYAPANQPGDLPSVAVQATAFQGWTMGTTRVSAATANMTRVRLGIADERGDGRPDFAYQARMFYADSVTPATIGAAGATVTITGSGFRNGNAVAINGVPVTVMSWSANTIVVKAPAMAAAGATSGVAVDVEVSDLSTGASTVMSAALTYNSNASLPNAMRLISVQTAAMYVGDVAPTPFAVQVVEADGVTPVAGETVVFSATAGNVQFGCGGAACSVMTNALGIAQTSMTPAAAGTVTVQAANGALTQSGSFTVQPQVGALILLAQPTGALNVSLEAGTPFAVQVVDANGSAMAFVPVTFSVVSGAATFSKCANPVCVVTSDGGGGAGTWVTPGSLGPITIRASVGDVGFDDTFTGASNVDTMQIVSTPAEPAYPYTLAGFFAVRLITPQGYGDSNQAVTFTAPPGLQFGACASNTCVGTTDWNGWVGFTAMGLAPGTYPLTASYGSVTQNFVFTVTDHTFSFKLISTPGTNVTPLVASATPFAVQLLEDGATPVSGAYVILQGANTDITIPACGMPGCGVNTDANGIASSSIVPLHAGVIPLTALFGAVALNASMTVNGVPDTLAILLAPPAGGAVDGVKQVLMVQLIGPDGVTGVNFNNMTWTVVSGPFSFTSCVGATCQVQSAGDGYDAIAGVAWGTGPVVVQVSNQQVSYTFQFNAVALPDVLQVVSVPAAGSYVGQAAAAPFAVQVNFNGGTMPVSGKTVTLSVTNGSAALAACAGASSCNVVTDANGVISMLITPLSPGQITLQVDDGGVIASASFTAAVQPDVRVVVGSPRSIFVAEDATVPVTLLLTATQNGGPAAAQAVQWTSGGGFVLAAAGTVTEASGSSPISANLGSLSGGAQAVATGCVWTNVCTSFSATGVAAANQQIVVVSGGTQTVSAGAAFAPLELEVVDGSGHPVVGAAVSIYQTVTEGTACPAQGRCPAIPIVASEAIVMTSGSDGMVWVTPLVVSGASPAGMFQTEIAASVGTQGFVTLTLINQD